MIPSIALRTAAIASRMPVGKSEPGPFSCSIDGIQYFKDLGFYDAVEHVAAIPPDFDQPCFSEDYELLRNAGLPKTEHRLDVADALLAIPENLEHCETGGVGDGPEKICLGTVCFHGRTHIQYSEYRIYSSDFRAGRLG